MGFRTYKGQDIDVEFNAKICIHAAECVKGLPNVFDVDKRPWISPDNEEADRIAEVVERCPSGALRYIRKDSGPGEQVSTPTIIESDSSGKLYIRGHLSIETDEKMLDAKRAILCGCGHSENKPFCDNSDICRS